MKTQKKIHLIILFMLSSILTQAQIFNVSEENYFGYELSFSDNCYYAQGLLGFNVSIGYSLQIKSGLIISPYKKLIPIAIEINTYDYKQRFYILVGKVWTLNDKLFKQSMMLGFGTAYFINNFYFKFGIIGIQTQNIFFGLNFSINYKF